MSLSHEFNTLAPCFWNCLGNSPTNTDDLKFPPVLSLCQKFCFFFILNLLKNAPKISTEDYCPLVYDNL